MSLKFSMILQAMDRISAPAKRMQMSMRGLGVSAKKLASDLRHPDRAYQRGYALGARLRGGLDRLKAGFGGAGRAAARYAGKAGLAAWTKGTQAAGRGVLDLTKKMGGLAGSAAKWAGAAAVGAAGFGLFDMFRIAGEFEQFQGQLEISFGSAAKAKNALGWISKFAATTPYELAEVTKAFIVLRQAGLDPTKGAMLNTADAAAATGKDLVESALAVQDALTGEFERLKDLGITASVAGDKVTLSYMKNEKQVTKVTSRVDKLALATATAAAMNDLYAGSVKKQGSTLFGIISNLKDQWSGFLLKVAQAGIFDLVKQKLQGLLDRLNSWAESGGLEEWARKISHWLEDAVKWATSFTQKDWETVKTNLEGVAKAAIAIAGAIADAANAYDRLTKYDDAISMGNTPGSRTENLWRVWNGQKPLKYSKDPTLGEYFFGGKPDPGQKEEFFNPPPQSGPRLKQPSAFQPGSTNSQVGGKLVVEVRPSAGASARVVSVAANNRNVPIVAALGRSMNGAA